MALSVWFQDRALGGLHAPKDSLQLGISQVCPHHCEFSTSLWPIKPDLCFCWWAKTIGEFSGVKCGILFINKTFTSDSLFPPFSSSLKFRQVCELHQESLPEVWWFDWTARFKNNKEYLGTSSKCRRGFPTPLWWMLRILLLESLSSLARGLWSLLRHPLLWEG